MSSESGNSFIERIRFRYYVISFNDAKNGISAINDTLQIKNECQKWHFKT